MHKRRQQLDKEKKTPDMNSLISKSSNPPQNKQGDKPKLVFANSVNTKTNANNTNTSSKILKAPNAASLSIPQTKPSNDSKLTKPLTKKTEATPNPIPLAQPGTPPPLVDWTSLIRPTERDKKKILKTMFNNLRIDIKPKFAQFNENNKHETSKWELIQLEETLKQEEMKWNQIKVTCKAQTKEYVEKIIGYQNIWINSSKGDILALEESNRTDDNQIMNWIDRLNLLNIEYEKEKNVLNKQLINEIKPLQKELKTEINAMKLLKMEINQFKNATLPPEIRKKIEVVLKYKIGA